MISMKIDIWHLDWIWEKFTPIPETKIFAGSTERLRFSQRFLFMKFVCVPESRRILILCGLSAESSILVRAVGSKTEEFFGLKGGIESSTKLLGRVELVSCRDKIPLNSWVKTSATRKTAQCRRIPSASFSRLSWCVHGTFIHKYINTIIYSYFYKKL